MEPVGSASAAFDSSENLGRVGKQPAVQQKKSESKNLTFGDHLRGLLPTKIRDRKSPNDVERNAASASENAPTKGFLHTLANGVSKFFTGLDAKTIREGVSTRWNQPGLISSNFMKAVGGLVVGSALIAVARISAFAVAGSLSMVGVGAVTALFIAITPWLLLFGGADAVLGGIDGVLEGIAKAGVAISTPLRMAGETAIEAGLIFKKETKEGLWEENREYQEDISAVAAVGGAIPGVALGIIPGLMAGTASTVLALIGAVVSGS